MKMSPSSELYIGIDAGGTKTRLMARLHDQQALIDLEGAGANLQRTGAAPAADALSVVIQDALVAYPLQPYHLCIGIAGGGRSEDQDSLLAALKITLEPRPPASLQVVDDARIALEAAFEGESGMVLIAGTGSIAYARTKDDAFLRAGGWGYLLGDDGSGYALGRAGLKAVAAHFDGGPDTELVRHARSALKIDRPEVLIRHVYRDKAPLQDFARPVLVAAQSGDAVATSIVQMEARALAAQAAYLAARAPGLSHRIAILGGLTTNAFYYSVLFTELKTLLPGWNIARLPHPPAYGALLLAEHEKA